MDAIDWAASARLSTARGADEFVVRERFAEEAPKILVVCDRRPQMAHFASPLPWLDKPGRCARSSSCSPAQAPQVPAVGYLDYADGDPHWRQPKGERKLIELKDDRLWSLEYGGPHDWLERSIAHLANHTRAVSPGTFVFVLSDFIPPPSGEGVAGGDREPLGPRARRDPGPDLGAELPGGERRRPPAAGPGDRKRGLRPPP